MENLAVTPLIKEAKEKEPTPYLRRQNRSWFWLKTSSLSKTCFSLICQLNMLLNFSSRESVCHFYWHLVRLHIDTPTCNMRGLWNLSSDTLKCWVALNYSVIHSHRTFNSCSKKTSTYLHYTSTKFIHSQVITQRCWNSGGAPPSPSCFLQSVYTGNYFLCPWIGQQIRTLETLTLHHVLRKFRSAHQSMTQSFKYN